MRAFKARDRIGQHRREELCAYRRGNDARVQLRLSLLDVVLAKIDDELQGVVPDFAVIHVAPLKSARFALHGDRLGHGEWRCVSSSSNATRVPGSAQQRNEGDKVLIAQEYRPAEWTLRPQVRVVTLLQSLPTTGVQR